MHFSVTGQGISYAQMLLASAPVPYYPVLHHFVQRLEVGYLVGFHIDGVFLEDFTET